MSKHFLVCIFLFMQLFPEIVSEVTKSVDPDQTAREWSDLGLHCLHTPFYQKLWCMKF